MIWVLDPFAGAGTTCQVAQSLLRNSVGIEIFATVLSISTGEYQLDTVLMLAKRV